MNNSDTLIQAKNILKSVANRTLSVEERRELSLELAALMLKEARTRQTSADHRLQAQLSKLMDDPEGKVFTTCLTDEAFRPKSSARTANQMVYLINKYGVPHFLPYLKQVQLLGFKYFGNALSSLFVPLAKKMLRRETSSVILKGERRPLQRHLVQRRREGVRTNLNHLGEAILGEEEAKHRLATYLEDLKRNEVEYISVKISTITSQINMLDDEMTLNVLENRLKQLYREAMNHTFVRPNGKVVPKFVNLDMEEYRDMHLTADLFRKVLDDPEFCRFSAGIVLQAYLPDSYLLLQELTVWAMKRVANGGAPVKIRLVKGANLAMEKVEASMKGWPQTPYTTKSDVDANYKRMMHYAMNPEHAQAARLGIASHNLFDIAYALLLRAEKGVEEFVEFEMLEGMADHIRRVVQELSGGMLLYCPAATQKEFVSAVAYLVRRLDENTAEENFLRHIFGLYPGTKEWQDQANQFSLACHAAENVSRSPRRTQNRFEEPVKGDPEAPFANEPDTDWALPINRKWIQQKLSERESEEFEKVPVVINGREIFNEEMEVGRDPACPSVELYKYSLADESQVDQALQVAVKAHAKWSKTSVQERSLFLFEIAHQLRLKRGELIAAMVADGGKTAQEADVEVSEAIDFAEYYRREMEKLAQFSDVEVQSKGVVLVTPPWNFPLAIPIGGVLAALVTGNSVLFKPAGEVAYVGWKIANLCWEAGVPKDVLQFLLCEDEPVGSKLIQDERVAMVVLTGATSTAKLMLNLRPGLDLAAETGGKNAIIATAMSDRDLAIKEAVYSAFGHAGQKCSACSLLILEKEVYDDPNFMQTLKDAAKSLPVGSGWDLWNRIPPLINEPGETLLTGLTVLEEGESWLLEPRPDPKNPRLWTPGIKLGVKPGSFSHTTEFFGPLLSVMRAESLEHAIEIVNGTPYGLTSGLQSLDDREHAVWKKRIVAGNLYINRGITGAIVRRQPFGGCKESSFGVGVKAGGPNYLHGFLNMKQKSFPKKQAKVQSTLDLMGVHLEKLGASSETLEIWQKSIGSYAYWYQKEFSKSHDPSLVVGQDNLFEYRPRTDITFRVNGGDDILDVYLVIAAAQICRTPLIVSGKSEKVAGIVSSDWLKLLTNVTLLQESESQLVDRIESDEVKRVRLLSNPTDTLKNALASKGVNVHLAPVLMNGRFELIHYLREVSISHDYHRYGNLGMRENEERAYVT